MRKRLTYIQQWVTIQARSHCRCQRLPHLWVQVFILQLIIVWLFKERSPGTEKNQHLLILGSEFDFKSRASSSIEIYKDQENSLLGLVTEGMKIVLQTKGTLIFKMLSTWNEHYFSTSAYPYFCSSIQRLQWVGRYVVVVSEDDEAQLYDSESERVIRFKNDAGVPFKCGTLDPLNQYFAASACDGMLYIFSIPEESDGNTGSLIHKVKIAKGKVDKFGADPLEVVWKGDGSQVYVSGEPLLGVVSRDTWGITYNKDYGHKKAKVLLNS